MEGLNDAIEQIEDSIQEGIGSNVAVRQAAEDWDLSPALLVRKFEEKHATPVEQWSPPLTKQQMLRLEAKQLACELAQGYQLSIDGDCMFPLYGEHVFPPGTIFTFDGNEWAFVGLQASGVLAAVGVSVDREERWQYEMLWRGAIPALRGLPRSEILEQIQRGLE